MENQDQLIQEAQQGDSAALICLLVSYRQQMEQYVRRHLPADLQSVLATEDVIQETHVDAFRGIARFQNEGPDAFPRWLTTLTRNRLLTMIDAQRTIKRGGNWRKYTLVDANSAAKLLSQLAADNETPSQIAGGDEAEQILQTALLALPDDYRAVIQLRFLQDLAYGEIAARMGRSEGAVKMLVQRARQQLQQLLGSASRFFSKSE